MIEFLLSGDTSLIIGRYPGRRSWVLGTFTVLDGHQPLAYFRSEATARKAKELLILLSRVHPLSVTIKTAHDGGELLP